MTNDGVYYEDKIKPVKCRRSFLLKGILTTEVSLHKDVLATEVSLLQRCSYYRDVLITKVSVYGNSHMFQAFKKN